MKLISKRIVTGLSMLAMQFAFAGDDVAQNCAPKGDCAKPCKPCPAVCFERGYPNTNCCFPAAYNEPANYDLAPCAWDFWVDASFTYWDALQDGMDLAVSSVVSATPALLQPNNGQYLFQDNQYKPGFKVGLGMDLGHDDWSAFAEYTWFRSTTNTSSVAPTDSRTGTSVWAADNWFKVATAGGSSSFTSLTSAWTLNMDLLDVGATRPYYQGTHLIAGPFGGIRGQWIRQKLDLSGTSVSIGNGTGGIASTSSNKSNSWAVGPRGGINGKWHLGYGVRVEGDIAASVLFTQYTKVATNMSPTVSGGDVTAASWTDYNCLRVGNEMNLGLGWGSYFDCRNYHLDLLATYDFQVFWNQNMMRALVDDLGGGLSGASAANLYLQGLTVKAQFDF
jgi:hypothetical protein